MLFLNDFLTGLLLLREAFIGGLRLMAGLRLIVLLRGDLSKVRLVLLLDKDLTGLLLTFRSGRAGLLIRDLLFRLAGVGLLLTLLARLLLLLMLLTLFRTGLLLMLLLCCGARSGLLLMLFGVKLLLMLLLRLTLGLLLKLLLGLILIPLLMAFLGLMLRLLDLPGRSSTKSGCLSVLLFDLVSDSIPLLRRIPFSLGD